MLLLINLNKILYPPVNDIHGVHSIKYDIIYFD